MSRKMTSWFENYASSLQVARRGWWDMERGGIEKRD
jgi:hypothetical protein